jgi:1-deoxy-D-xylulose-5-phosphate reductoisomerase
VVVLGATGSIGTQALEVAAHLGLEVAGIAARSPSPALAAAAAGIPDAVVVATGGSGDERAALAGELGERARFGTEELIGLAAWPGATVVNGIVGSVGLRSTVAALEAGNRVALANKESLVAGGEVVTSALTRGGGELIPVDSEHSALFQCLIGESVEDVARLVLTASGGPFRGMTREQLEGVTPEQALRHPTWDMGPRITIDSATLFNKGLEVIEAHHLFGIGYDRIDVVVHPQSVLHSVVEFVDGSWKGHLGQTDMRIPIQYALTAPARTAGVVSGFELAGRELSFEEPDRAAFPSLDLAFDAGRRGGSAPAVLNAADEVAVEAFLQHRLGFNGIFDVVASTMEAVPFTTPTNVDEVVEVDREARAVAASTLAGAC